MHRFSTNTQKRASIILAGDDASRASLMTEKVADRQAPKQFCLVFGEESMLDRTLRRVSTSGPDPRNLTLTVVTRAHKRSYENKLVNNQATEWLVQPQNRGTAPAILYALLRLEKIAWHGAVAIFPGDHYMSDDRKFMSHVNGAVEALRSFPEQVILLGIKPDGPEAEFDWIEPGALNGGAWASRHRLRRVRQFWEKPSVSIARELYRRECLWNSFVVIANVHTLLELYASALPHLYTSFGAFRPTLGTQFEEKAIDLLYHMIVPASFSDTILVSCFSRLAVMPVSGLSWSEFRSAGRLAAVPMRVTSTRPCVELIRSSSAYQTKQISGS